MQATGFEPVSAYAQCILSASPWARLGYACSVLLHIQQRPVYTYISRFLFHKTVIEIFFIRCVVYIGVTMFEDFDEDEDDEQFEIEAELRQEKY